MLQAVKVLKRDGSIEEFNHEKIARVVQAAGLETSQAKLLADKIADFVSGNGQGPIPSSQIKDKVVEELTKVDKHAAGLFTWYEKTKDH